MAVLLLKPQDPDSCNDRDPIEVIRYNRAVGSGVIPAEDGVENAPAASTVEFGTTALDLILSATSQLSDRGV